MLAAELGVTTAQLVFAFARQRGMLPLTGTTSAEHMRLDLASVMLQWATGGLLFCWVTTRRREVSLGYGWLIRGVFALVFYILFGVFRLLRALVRLVTRPLKAARDGDGGPGATAPVPARSTA